MRCAVFDLDGTLADTSADLIAAANQCFINAGITARLDPVADRRLGVLGGRAMLTEGFARAGLTGDAAPIRDYYQTLLNHYDDNICLKTRLYEGALSTVDQLRDAGWRVAICTNKPEYLAVKLIDQLGISDRFEALLGADTLPVRKPDPEHLFETIRRAGGAPDRAVLMGDSTTDLAAAAAAGIPCVLMVFDPPGPETDIYPVAATLTSYLPLTQTLDQLVPETA